MSYRMTRKEEIEEFAKGTIEAHTTIGQLPVAFGYESTDDGKKGIAYIYNVPQSAVDKGYFQVRASENGGTDPRVATPSPREFVLGFEYADYEDSEGIYQVCKDTIEDIGFGEDDVVVDEMIEEAEATDNGDDQQTDSISIDLSDSFK